METQNCSAIVILGGGVIFDNAKWRTKNFSEKDHIAILGDNLRVQAAAKLFLDNPKLPLWIIASGGEADGEKPSIASVIRDELVELGVPAEVIILEENSDSTYQQLLRIKDIATEKMIMNLMLITNRYHIDRVLAMIEKKYIFNDCPGLLVYTKSAEEILLVLENGKWQAIIDAAYQTPEMTMRIALEKKGIDEINSGVYNFQ